MHTPIGLVGASGYAGIELTRLLSSHPEVELRFLASDRWQGEAVSRRLGDHLGYSGLRYSPLALALELSPGCAAVLLATPAESSLELVPELLSRGIKVIDLSGAFRLRDASLYSRFYGFEHSHPELLREAVYGLPELGRDRLRGAPLVANPGCFPTAASLLFAPLLSAGLLEESRVIVDAASGVTGAGRKGTEELSFAEVAEDFRAYKVQRHPHTPEMAQCLKDASGQEVLVTFTPHLLPVRRGILATGYARLKPGVGPGAPMEVLVHKYAHEPFVSVVDSPEEVSLKAVCGTNCCSLSVSCVDGQLVGVCAIDNLLKGAAGQAMQNLNLVMGWDESTSLTGLRGHHP
jgi:N-acetyl-gamma-glutamyl-phosphate reductase